MSLAEELWKKHRNHQDNDSFPAAMHHSFLAAINEALERAAQECDTEAESITTCLNPTSAVNALRYTSERIRALKVTK